MLNKIILFTIMSWAVTGAWAQDVELKADHPDSYTVVKGDTLWAISGKFLQEPWRWPEIWKVNPQIADPNLIYPGDVVTLRFEDGSPVLSVERGGGGSAGGESGGGSAASGRNVKMTPQIREYSREGAITAIPIDIIRHLLSRPLVLNDKEMDAWPYIVSGKSGHLVAGKSDIVYVRGLDGDAKGNYSIYRKGPAYKNGRKVLGYEALHVADAVVLENGDPATVRITQSTREVMAGDRLVAQSEKDVNSDFIPRSPGSNIEGAIISAVDGVVSSIGQYQVVVVDRGTADGLNVGNVLGIYQSGEVIEDRILNEKPTGGLNDTALMDYLGKFKGSNEKVELPNDLAGVMMIFRSFDEVSYGLVMEAYGAIHIADKVKNL